MTGLVRVLAVAVSPSPSPSLPADSPSAGRVAVWLVAVVGIPLILLALAGRRRDGQR